MSKSYKYTSETILQLSDLSYSQLVSAIKIYQSLNFKTTSITYANKLFRLIIKNFITQTLSWNAPVIYRARKHTDKSLFLNTSELIYPPKATNYGRFNDIGESIFYAASHHDTAIMEMRPKLGDEITIFESRLIDPLICPKYFEIGIRELLMVQNHSLDFLQQNHQFLIDFLKTEDNLKRYKLINKFLVNEITKIIKDGELYKYKGTIVIGQFCLNGNDLVDGIIYPSINRGGSDCVAIKPRSFDRFYRADRCFKIKVMKVYNNIPEVQCVNHSTNIDNNGNVFWI